MRGWVGRTKEPPRSPITPVCPPCPDTAVSLQHSPLIGPNPMSQTVLLSHWSGVCLRKLRCVHQVKRQDWAGAALPDFTWAKILYNLRSVAGSYDDENAKYWVWSQHIITFKTDESYDEIKERTSQFRFEPGPCPGLRCDADLLHKYLSHCYLAWLKLRLNLNNWEPIYIYNRSFLIWSLDHLSLHLGSRNSFSLCLHITW